MVPLSTWPRSRQGSLADGEVEQTGRVERVGSTASTMTEVASPIDVEKGEGWAEDGDRRSKDSAVVEGRSPRDSAVSGQSGPALPSSLLMRDGMQDSSVPKTRLSGGLAEMGELSLQDTTQGWPIYWR